MGWVHRGRHDGWDRMIYLTEPSRDSLNLSVPLFETQEVSPRCRSAGGLVHEFFASLLFSLFNNRRLSFTVAALCPSSVRGCSTQLSNSEVLGAGSRRPPSTHSANRPYKQLNLHSSRLGSANSLQLARSITLGFTLAYLAHSKKRRTTTTTCSNRRSLAT